MSLTAACVPALMCDSNEAGPEIGLMSASCDLLIFALKGQKIFFLFVLKREIWCKSLHIPVVPGHQEQLVEKQPENLIQHNNIRP